jgi:hypothetical protein
VSSEQEKPTAGGKHEPGNQRRKRSRAPTQALGDALTLPFKHPQRHSSIQPRFLGITQALQTSTRIADLTATVEGDQAHITQKN